MKSFEQWRKEGDETTKGNLGFTCGIDSVPQKAWAFQEKQWLKKYNRLYLSSVTLGVITMVLLYSIMTRDIKAEAKAMINAKLTREVRNDWQGEGCLAGLMRYMRDVHKEDMDVMWGYGFCGKTIDHLNDVIDDLQGIK